jgi:hypothetical protein
LFRESPVSWFYQQALSAALRDEVNSPLHPGAQYGQTYRNR